jgi:hypothetical protein
MQIKLRRASLAEPSERSSAATPLISNISQRTDLVRRHCNSPLDGPRTVPAIPHAYRLRPTIGPHARSNRQSIHIGHALGSGFVQSIFSPPSRRPPFECFPSVSRRAADLKILCSIPLTEYCPFRALTPICRKNSLGSMIRPNGRNCYRRWPMGRRRPKGI